MFRYKLLLQYDGTNYYGWQYQKPNKYGVYPTIQSELHRAVFNLTGETVTSMGAGRTDAGVHATKQVCHAELTKYIMPEKLMEGLNHFLQDTGIAVYGAEFVQEDFHARFSAKAKTYNYLIWNSLSPNVFYTKKAWHVPKQIDLDRFEKELFSLKEVGGTSFQSFRDRFCQAKHPNRKIDEVGVEIIENTDIYKSSSTNKCARLIKVTFSAQSFLHHQVRIMIGTLVDLCIYNRSHNILDILKAEDRTKAAITAPPQGLYLVDVEY